MGIVIKQSFWSTIISYLGVIIGYFNIIYLRAKYFELSQIGLFTLIISNAIIVSTVSSLGMGSSYIRFFSSFHENNKNCFFSFLFLITIVGNAIIILCIYLFKDTIALRYIDTAPLYISYLSITAVIIISSSLFNLLICYSQTIMKIVFPSFLYDIYLKIGLSFLVFGYAINWWDFNSSITGLGLIYFSVFAFLFFQLIVNHHFKFDFSLRIISKEWRIKLLKFGSYSVLIAGSGAFINNVSYDQVTTILGTEMNGIFTTCFFIATIVDIPKRNIANIVTPIISKEFQKNNMKEVKILYERSSIAITVIGILLFIGIATNLQDLFNFIPKGNEFQAGFWVVVGICFSKLLGMVSIFAGDIISFSSNYKYNLIFHLTAAIVLVIMNYFLISSWGLNGAIISYTTATLLHVSLKLAFVRYRFGIHPFIKSHISLIIIGLSVAAGAYYFQLSLHPVVNIILRSFLTTLIFVSLIYRFRISTDINKIIHSIFKRFLKINLPK